MKEIAKRLKPEDMIVFPAGTSAEIKEDAEGKYIDNISMVSVVNPAYLDLVMSMGK